MFTFTLFLAVTFTTVSSSKCPEDPLACIFRSHHSTSQFIAIKLQQSTGGDADASATGDSMSPPASHHRRVHADGAKDDMMIESGSSVHQDGRFFLNDTQAAGCVYDETSNGTSVCKKCSSCPKNGRLIRSCSREHDTICMCERGSYLDILAYECKSCSPCAHGSGVWKKCNRHRDTVCRPCMPGFYSGVLSNDLSCSPCDTCTSNQIMLQECSRIENTVCIDRSIGKRLHFAPSAGQRKDLKSGNHVNVSHSFVSHDSAKHSKQYPDDNQEHQSGLSNMNGDEEEKSAIGGHYYDYSTSHASLHVYFAILVVIICCVCFYVLLQRRLHQKAKNAPFKGHMGNIYIRSANLDSLYSPLSQYCHHALRSPHQNCEQQIQPNEQLQSCKHLVNHQSLRSQSRKFTKQEHKVVSANDSYRLLGSNSPANRSIQQQQQLVLTFSDNLHPPKYLDASDVCYLPHSPYDERSSMR